MRTKLILASGVGVLGLVGAAGAVWLLSLPPGSPSGSTAAAAPPIGKDEADALLAALKPPKRERPVIAIVGINHATESTDYLMPYGILRRADVAEVMLLSTERGPVELFPALTVEPQATIADFDTQHPDGADYVIVPAMSRDDDPAVTRWIQHQSSKGAMIVGVCAGAKVVAATGLLDRKRATTHWYYLKELRRKHPTIDYVPDRRIVVDGGVATTTGISASMPVALTMIEAIAGHEKAAAVAREIGLPHWDARHNSQAFQFTRPFAMTAMGNSIAIWNREKFGIALTPDIDEVSLALVADAWSRTYRSHAFTFAPTADAIPTRNGVRVIPDHVVTQWPSEHLLPAIGNAPPAEVLDHTLDAIRARYGSATARFVTKQLEYPKD